MKFEKMLDSILSAGGISGVIAVIIAGTICARYFTHGPEDIPQILTYSMTTIIGFYFGTGVSKASASSQNSTPVNDQNL